MCAFCPLNFTSFLLSPARLWPLRLCPKSHPEPLQRSKDSSSLTRLIHAAPLACPSSSSCLPGPSSHFPVHNHPVFFQNLLPVLTSFCPGFL